MSKKRGTPREPRRVQILWTSTARECLKNLPIDVARGLVTKADELYTCHDPRHAHKPLTGPLQGYYRITFGRYRAIYRVDERRDANGEKLITVTITFVAAGIRREHTKDDVYRVAQRLVALGLVEPPPTAPPPGEPPAAAPPGPAKKAPKRRR